VAISLVIGLCIGQGILPAQDQGSSESADDTVEATASTNVQEEQDEYPGHKRRFAANQDPLTRLDKSLPKPGSLVDSFMPERLTQFKKGLHEKHGLKLGVSYQSLYQKASASLTDEDSAWGGWFLFNSAWTPLNRGQDWEGTLVFVLDARHIINPSTNAEPGIFHVDTGSLWPTDGAFYSWNLYPATFFWEQWGARDRFAFRVGQLAAIAIIDPFRFDEVKSSFTGTLMTNPFSIIPVAAPGLGVAAKWWPVKDSDLYVVGIISDINAQDGVVSWNTVFQNGEIFAGGEVGYNRIRTKDDFDHAHLTLWHADEASTAAWDTTAGWGFKLSGHKQLNRFVVFGHYAYNTAEGGGLGATNSRRAVSVGAARIHPAGIKGEIALALSRSEPIDDGFRSQSGLELYWKILVTPNLWLTPGVQYIVDPTFTLEIDRLWIPQIKFSLFF
jgi:hypothetical protein